MANAIRKTTEIKLESVSTQNCVLETIQWKVGLPYMRTEYMNVYVLNMCSCFL